MVVDNKQKDNQNDTKTVWWQPGLLLAVQITGWIAGPIIAGLFIGRWLDEKYGTDPWLFLASVGAAFVITSIGIVKETFKAYRKIEEEEKKKNQESGIRNQE